MCVRTANCARTHIQVFKCMSFTVLQISMQARVLRNTHFVDRVVNRWAFRWAHRDVSSALDAWRAYVINHKRVALLGVKIVRHWACLIVSRAHIRKRPLCSDVI